MRTYGVSCLAVIGLAACASMDGAKPDFQTQAQAWVGQPEATLIAKKGLPAKTSIRSYEDGRFIEKTMEYQGAAALGNLGAVGVRYRPTLINGQWVQLPEKSVLEGPLQVACNLRFKLNEQNIVTAWTAEGKDCN